jgi:hypothetical protein
MRDPRRKQVLKLLIPNDPRLICTTGLSLARLGGVPGASKPAGVQGRLTPRFANAFTLGCHFGERLCMDEMSLASFRADIAPHAAADAHGQQL